MTKSPKSLDLRKGVIEAIDDGRGAPCYIGIAGGFPTQHDDSVLVIARNHKALRDAAALITGREDFELNAGLCKKMVVFSHDKAIMHKDESEKFTWSKDEGYECSSRGDKRFSALYARMPDERTIEMHYQCDVKGYNPGGMNWRAGKGKPAVDPSTDLWAGYLALWRIWARTNGRKLLWLGQHALKSHEGKLRDSFCGSSVNQAAALATLLNELWSDEPL